MRGTSVVAWVDVKTETTTTFAQDIKGNPIGKDNLLEISNARDMPYSMWKKVFNRTIIIFFL